jgi:hypothetical protein
VRLSFGARQRALPEKRYGVILADPPWRFEVSRARAIETWPAHAKLFARKRDHNRAEAALLGLYALKAVGE